MNNYFSVGTYPSSRKPYLAPDNFVGRFGATMWGNTDNGIGSWVISSIGLIISSFITWGTLAGITLGGAAGTFWAFMSIFSVAITALCILTAVSTIYVRFARIRVPDGYGRRYDSGHTIAQEIAQASEVYRGMNRNDRRTFNPVIKKMRTLCREGEFEDARKRAEKFNEARRALDNLVQKSKFVDNSDLDEMDALIRGIAEIRAGRVKTVDTRPRLG